MRQKIWISLSLCLALLAVSAACRADSAGPGTTGTAAVPVKVTDVTLGRAIGDDKTITERTETFRPTDTIYASISTEGTAANTNLRARWTYEDGQVVDETTRAIAPNSRERTEFHIAKPNGWPAGKYQVEVFVDDRSVETKKFEVRQD